MPEASAATPSTPARLPDLTVAVSTIGRRFLALGPEDLPAVSGVAYLVCVQGAEGQPDFTQHAEMLARRGDVTVRLLEGRGVARSRNAAITVATTELLLFADDDLVLLGENYDALRRIFKAQPSLDFICGRVVDTDHKERKRYSRDGQRVRIHNCAKAGTPEIAIRLASVRRAGVRFDEQFGAGAPLWLGDEYVFLADCLRGGLRGRHIALALAVHARESSGTSQSPETHEVRRQVIRRAVGWCWQPALWAFALRHRRQFASLRDILSFVRPGWRG